MIKMAQTFRSGTNDIDALDFVEMFLEMTSPTSASTISTNFTCSSISGPS